MNEPTLLRKDTVNDGIRLYQNPNGLTFGSDALMLSAYIEKGFDTALELGGGTGVISLLLLKKEKAKSVTVLEVQPSFAELCQKNADENGFSDRMRTLAVDLRDFSEHSAYSLVFTNPPYMKDSGGKRNIFDEKNIARHEMKGTIHDFCQCAKASLKFGGAFYAVYRPDRLEDLLVSMRACRIEPKRMTFVHADADMPPAFVLIEGKRGGGASLRVTPPLILYLDNSHTQYSNDYKYICDHGKFPDKFRITNMKNKKEQANATGKESD
ncbi:MAG: methyltransferase [Clostridia bacterium]|nr:methyltransferase [Clostridia bacterium]